MMYCYIKEYDLMREVLFALQGLNGRIIRQDEDGRFTITKLHIEMIDPTQRMLLEKLTSFGWLVNKIKNHINSINKDPYQGKVGQCLAAALNNELMDYYGMVTQIEKQLQKCANQDNGRTRASTPTSELYGCNDLLQQQIMPKPSATFESLNTVITNNANINPNSGFNGVSTHHNHLNHLHLNQQQQQLNSQQQQHLLHHQQQYQMASSDDSLGSQMYLGPSSNASPTAPSVTLHQIHLWSLEHYYRLKTLAMLVECCKNERGGRLARIVYRFMQQGDKQIRAIITRILSQVVLPIRVMLSQWIFRGEIQDPFDEFFICLETPNFEGLTSSVTMMSLTTSTPHKNFNGNQHHHQHHTSNHAIDNINLPPHMQQHRNHLPTSNSMSSLTTTQVDDKRYVINDFMMPGFITRQQANKILATGKAIHLLRKVCADSVANSVPGYDDLKKSFESTDIETLFRSKELGEEDEFEHLLNRAYKEVSQKALELLFGNYRLRSHFRGLRQYLLLGQGDFIRHLMDLLKTELDKQATECRFHNILAVLESAMRSTNAQFDEPDVTNRLDCRLIDATSPQALGWDIFSLVYKVDGPISTIFTEEKMRDYVDIFRQLWRTKRIEHVLTSLWSNQMSYTKQAANSDLPLLNHVHHRANLLLSDMIHFMQHYQNFIMFEVVECSWVKLAESTTTAKDVDDVVAAHDIYLSNIKTGTMCQKETNTLFECILEMQQLMISLWKEIDSDIKNWPHNLNTYQTRIQTLANKFKANRRIKFDK